jgi:hypothetical protein
MISALRIVRKMVDDYFYNHFEEMDDEQRLDLKNILDQIDYVLKAQTEDF